MKRYYVYILECSDLSFYTGMTSHLEKRLIEHNMGDDEEAYTYLRRPVTLKWCEEFSSAQKAIEVEKQIKGWSRRKKIALIERDWDQLMKFSKNYTQFGKGDE
jgi:putative endonuclease